MCVLATRAMLRQLQVMLNINSLMYSKQLQNSLRKFAYVLMYVLLLIHDVNSVLVVLLLSSLLSLSLSSASLL